MNRTPRSSHRLVALTGFALLIGGIAGPPRARADDEREPRFPNVLMRTQDDKEVRFYDDLIKGKVVLINLMYTRCDGKLCDQSTNNLVQVQKALGDRLGREVFIYSITLDPEHDTPEVLKAYAEAHDVKPGWTFLTTAQGEGADASPDAAITDLRKSLGMSNLDPDLRNRLGLPDQDLAADEQPRQHTGMMLIGNDPFNRWTKVSVLSTPGHILQTIERMKPPDRTLR